MNIKRFVLLATASLFLGHSSFAKSSARATASSSGSPGPFGIGVILGIPTAIVGKYWLDNRHAIDGGVGAYFGNYTLLYGDYLFHFPGAMGHSSEFTSDLIPYFGVGPVLAFTNDTYRDNSGLRGKNSGAFGLGVRVPGGFEWKPHHIPIGVFAELAPGIAILPGVGLFFQIGIGIRYYF